MRSGQRVPQAVVWVVAIMLLSACAGMMGQDTPESLIQEGQRLYAAKDYDGAIAKYGRAVKLDKSAWMAYLGLARCYIAKMEWQPALTNARQAFALAPSGTEVITTLAGALFGAGKDALLRGQFADAIGYFLDYVRVQPADPAGYLNAGKAYLGSGAWGDALRVLVQGLPLAGAGPARQEFLQSLLAGGTGALTQGKAQDAIGFLQQYLQHDPGSLTALLNLGKAYWQNGDMLQALNAYRQALNLSPGNEEALRFLRGIGR